MTGSGKERDGRRRRGGRARPARERGEGPEVPRPRRLVAPERVVKRDGREVPFERAKIAAAVAAAMEAVGEEDAALPSEVAHLVELTLGERALRPGRDPAQPLPPPSIEEIQDLVERALMEMGRPAVAKAYILYRDRRSRIRDAVRVQGEPSSKRLRVRDRDGSRPWDKAELAAALIDEADLTRTAAEEVATAVERRVLASGLERLSTGLLRELVTAELAHRGHAHALRLRSRIGLSRRELQGLLESRAAAEGRADTAASASEQVGTRVLERYALEEHLEEGVAELHREGDLFVEDLEHPDLLLSLAADLELLVPPGAALSTPFAALDAVAELLHGVTRLVVLERPGPVLAPLLRGGRGSLTSWLLALGALSRASGVRLHLAGSGPRFGAFHGRLLEELLGLGEGAEPLGLHLDGHEIEALLRERADLAASVDAALAQGRLVASFGDDAERYAGPGCHRVGRERGLVACAGAVSLNLVRLARRAGPWREDLVLSGLAELVQAGLEAGRAVTRTKRKLLDARAFGFFARPAFALSPVGLREALLVLGDGQVDPEQGARLLGLVADAARRFALDGTAVVAPTPCFASRAPLEFANQDGARAARARQRWLFADGEEVGAPRPYAAGFHLSPHPEWAAGEAEAECLRTLPAGTFPAPRPSPEDPSETPCLDAWRRFEMLRRSHSGDLSLELFTLRPPATSGPGGTEPAPAPLRPLR